MEGKALDSVIKTTEVKRNPVDEMSGGREKKTEEVYGNKKVKLKRSYDAISKNGDTLELSEDGKKLRKYSDMSDSSISTKKIVSDTVKKISDNTLCDIFH